MPKIVAELGVITRHGARRIQANSASDSTLAQQSKPELPPQRSQTADRHGSVGSNAPSKHKQRHRSASPSRISVLIERVQPTAPLSLDQGISTPSRASARRLTMESEDDRQIVLDDEGLRSALEAETSKRLRTEQRLQQAMEEAEARRRECEEALEQLKSNRRQAEHEYADLVATVDQTKLTAKRQIERAAEEIRILQARLEERKHSSSGAHAAW